MLVLEESIQAAGNFCVASGPHRLAEHPLNEATARLATRASGPVHRIEQVGWNRDGSLSGGDGSCLGSHTLNTRVARATSQRCLPAAELASVIEVKLLFIAVVALASSAGAQGSEPAETGPLGVLPPDSAREPVYRYRDRSGQWVYTNVPAAVPRKARAEVTSGDDIGLLPSRDKAAELPDGWLRSSEQREQEDEALRNRWSWRFTAARLRLKQLERELADERLRLEDAQRASSSAQARLQPVAYSRNLPLQNAELEIERIKRRVQRLEDDLREARDELQELDLQASRAGVPQKYRR